MVLMQKPASAKALGMAMKPMRAYSIQQGQLDSCCCNRFRMGERSSQMRRAMKKQWISCGIKSSRLAEFTRKIPSRLGKSMQLFSSKAEMLNKEQFSALHYTAPGTDLTLGFARKTMLGICWSYQYPRQKASCQICRQKRSFTAPD